MSDVYWDPYDIGIDISPYAIWQRLRDEAPVYHNEKYGFYALSRYADVERAHLQPATYSSNHGVVLEQLGPHPMTQSGMIIMQDPPVHDVLRALVSRAFTPTRVAAMEGFIRSVVIELLDQHRGSDGFDYVADFGAIVPSKVISHLLGVPESDRERIRQTIDTVFHIEPEVGMFNDTAFGAMLELNTYLVEQIEWRRTHESDDMLGALVAAEVDTPDGRRTLTTQEAADFGNLLVSAGTETVGKLLGWAAIVLAENPETRAELAADRSLVPKAIEELLRYESPSPVQGRWTKTDTVVEGVAIPKDSKVLLLTASANRDERRYANADRFDIHRTEKNHLALGFGVHYCLGASLARLEGRVGLEETLTRFPTWDTERSRGTMQHTSTVRGWTHVPITL